MIDLDALERLHAANSGLSPDHVHALIAELRAARQDAAKWRHVRDQFPRTIYEQCGLGTPGPHEYITPEQLDAAADAAIAKGGPT